MQIFIPRNIEVGYQKEKLTYSGKLAYIIYFDHLSKLRKEVSWEGWIDKSIKTDSFINKPTDGFVLNKKAGGYSSGWNHRQSYIRVYDPRGFEFEITLENLLYIIENVNSLRGKGLDGKFVYAWEGPSLLLVPVDAPDYKKNKEYSDMLFDAKTLKGKDLILGATYNTKQGNIVTYLGRFDYFPEGVERKKTSKKYFFRTHHEKRYNMYETVSTLKNKIISLADDTCAENYASMIDDLDKESFYSPLDQSKFKFTEVGYESISNASREYFYLLYKEDYIPVSMNNYYIRLSMYGNEKRYEYFDTIINSIIDKNHYNGVDIRSICRQYKIFTAKKYLKNGNKLRSRYE